MSPAELRERLTGGASATELAVLDVRSPLARSRGHLARSCGVPLHGLEQRVAALVPRRETSVVLASDPALDAWAARVLRDLGHLDVHVLDGGVDAWRAAGERLYTGTGVRPKTLGEWAERALDTPTVDPATLAAWRAAGEDVVVIDARPHDEYVHHHVPGALDLGGGAELPLRAGGLLDRAGTRVIVTCAGRTRGIIGAQTLRETGTTTEVYSLRHGLPAWGWAEQPLATGPDDALTDTLRADVAVEARERARDLLARTGVDVLAAPPTDPAVTTYLVDVRSPAEHAAGVVAGARAIQGGQLVQAADDHLAVLRSHLVLVDSADLVRASVTARWLRHLHDGPISVLVHDPALVAPPTQTAPPSPPVPRVVRPGDADLVLDLRTSAHYLEGHLPGSMLARREDLPAATAGAAAGSRRVVLVDGGGAPAPAGRDLQAPPRTPVDASWAAAELLAAGVDVAVVTWHDGLPATTADPLVAGGEVADHVGPPPFGPARDAWYADYFAWEHAMLVDCAGDPDFAFTAEAPGDRGAGPSAVEPRDPHHRPPPLDPPEGEAFP